jgi:uncharacterized protein YjbI with pentapeptide repeats
LTGANFSGSCLAGAYLSGANFTGVTLGNANLFGANFSGVLGLTSSVLRTATSLSGINFSGDNLSGVNLSGMNLSYSNFSSTNLFGANLANDNLVGVIASQLRIGTSSGCDSLTGSAYGQVLVGCGANDTLNITSSNHGVTLDINDFTGSNSNSLHGYSTINGFDCGKDLIVLQGRACEYSLSHVGHNDILCHNGTQIATINNSNLNNLNTGFTTPAAS